MALIKCPECNRDVSDKATVCPHCARPLAWTSYRQGPVQVIERTGRRWKGVRVLGWLLILAAAFALIAQWAADDSRAVTAGLWIGLAGVACLWISRAGAWWYHG
jgi:hypothetical protein